MQTYGPDDLGELVSGQLNSADASSGVEVTLYDDAGGARTLASDEELTIDYASIVSAPGGDVYLFFDADDDNALDAGETIWRGTVAANGGAILNYSGNPRVGTAGAKPHVIAPAGAIDVTLRGRISKTISRTDPQNPHYVG